MSDSREFDWTRFLELARDLVKPGAGEAHLRSGISRAYYAAFNVARKFLMVRGELRSERRNRPGTHQIVWLKFKEGPSKQRRTIGNRGSGLHLTRCRADYDAVFRGHLRNKAIFALQEADEIVKSVEFLRERG